EIDLVRAQPERECAEDGGADARAAQHIEHRAAFRERLEHADMGGTERSAGGGNVTGRASGEEAMQALEVAIVLERCVVMHRDVAAVEPRRGVLDPAGAALMQADEAAACRRMRGKRKGLDLVGVACWRTGYDDQHLVGLPDRLARPVSEAVVGEI